MKYKPFAFILGGLLVFSACSKDSDSDSNSNTGPAPVVDPIGIGAAKPNDTLTLKGQNFSTGANGNVVKVNDVAVTIISATATEIKIVIPATVAPGMYTITITANGKTTEIGQIAINPLTYYMIKGVFTNGSEYQLITINTQTGAESLVASLGKDRLNSVIYYPLDN
ncbi:IPT/TIG domain-containing protein [Niastella yeongjuensis]|nr:IPT/TIG domain-containing protein [Niastella yeongjuensis]SEP18663.1 hypothetical protein SAMN05660816_04654 [Niastella yeongjuensis]